MAKKEMEMPPMEVPSITKVITCSKCGTKMKIEFELDLVPLLPVIAGGLEEAAKKKIEEKDTAEVEIK